ncbi:MAG: lysoplasmalogenase [Bacteroidota bacterium]
MFEQKNRWLFLFALDALLNLLGEIIQHIPLIYVTKPLLMVFLSIHFYQNRSGKSKWSRYILWALLFSFLGDTFLMIRITGTVSQQLFLLGLGSFLITQLLYFLAFRQYASKQGFIRKQPLVALIFLAILIGNSFFLLPNLPNTLKFPVLLYSTIITLMVVSCVNLYGLLPSTIFKVLLTGVLLFMLSDSLIGLNQFKKETIQIPFPRLAIMGTYIVAQYLIVKGSIYLSKNPRKGSEAFITGD